MSKVSRIILACGLGGMGGTTVALAIMPMAWWLGALLGMGFGGLASGFIYAFSEIRTSAPAALRIAWHGLVYLPKALRLALLPYWIVRGIYKAPYQVILGFFVACMYVLTFCIYIIYIGFMIPMNGLMFFVGGAGYMVFIGVKCMDLCLERIGKEKTTKKDMVLAVVIASPAGPAIFSSLIALWILRNIPTFVRAGIETGIFMARFVKTLFFFIHSRELVLCCVDGGLAVLIALYASWNFGLSAGPTIVIGGLGGAILGVLNYEVVSKRVLHVA